MPGIAGIAAGGKAAVVSQMLAAVQHRGGAGRRILELAGATLGAVWNASLRILPPCLPAGVQDGTGAGHCARATLAAGRLLLERDPLGVAPLYYGHTAEGTLAFASEVKALLGVTADIQELPPGHRLRAGGRPAAVSVLPAPPLLADSPAAIARTLRERLARAVQEAVRGGEVMGSWLSGGLDSSVLAALARPLVRTLHTFAAGVAGAPDLEHAREVARFLRTEHHEVVVTLPQMQRFLPVVIRSLESFDALLVRSSVTNYLVAQAAAEYVPDTLSGEGGDELFAGYHYLKALPPTALAAELRNLLGALHNTALQRVDRSAAAHGLVAHLCFLAPAVVDYALRIPVELKLRNGVEKWILRQALAGALPERILARPKAKFWEGAGVSGLLAEVAESAIPDGEFQRERLLPNGWSLASKEELFYYRLFREQFGRQIPLEWMGRTKTVAMEVAAG